MATIRANGRSTRTAGELPEPGSRAPEFRLTRGDLSDCSLRDFQGRRVILNIVPSIDTGVCAMSTRKFEQQAREVPDLKVLTVSADLPFANNRFAEAEGIRDVELVSQFRDAQFGRAYGATIVEGPMAGLLSRAVVVIDRTGRVAYRQQVTDLGDEPDYEAALKAARNAK